MNGKFNLSEWALKHQSFVWYLMFVAVVAGIFSYINLGRAEDPSFAIKTMVIQTRWPGATVDETRLQITDRIEKKLEELDSLDYVQSYTRPGESTVFVFLKDTTKADAIPNIWYEVRKKIWEADTITDHKLPYSSTGAPQVAGNVVVIGNYASAAGRAKKGGLDGVELSAVHQHMIDQFWSPRVNKRTDEWGGSFENRMRFGLEVLKAVRAEVGPDFCVGIRLCGDEFHPDGLSHEDMKQIAKYYDDTGMLDFIGVVGSGCDTHNTLANVIPNMSFPPEPFLHLAAGIKEVVKAPVLHAQNIKDPNQATRILEGGYVDMVGMTRAHIADPHLIAKIKMGQVDQIKQCVGANYCIDRQYQGLDVLCIQNAATSREYMGVPHIIEKSTGARRKVVIVGAGPAGMEAARVAAERGHDVTLFEKKDAIGGQITTASKAPQRDQMAGITRWFQLELARLNVDLRLGTAADAATIMDLRPDIVVLAVGGHPFVEQNEHWGAAEGLVVSSWDVLDGKVEPGKNVLVYDTICEFTGMSVADYMADKGAQVEIVTDDTKPGVAIGAGSDFRRHGAGAVAPGRH